MYVVCSRLLCRARRVRTVLQAFVATMKFRTTSRFTRHGHVAHAHFYHYLGTLVLTSPLQSLPNWEGGPLLRPHGPCRAFACSLPCWLRR